MKRTLCAEIEWLCADVGGRKSPPTGPQFVAPVRFEDEPWETWSQNAWSLVVELIEASDAFHWKARAAYLMSDAPHAQLRPGRRFELYEGHRCVARGTLRGPVA